jgi:putative redox protein
MPKHHTAHVVLEEGLRFTGAADSGYAITMDDSADAGGGGGVTPVELVLIGLAGCSGMDVAAILRKQRQLLRGLEVRAHGTRRDELPRIFTDIALEFIVQGDRVEPAAVARALELTATRYCSVWGMLVPNAAITWSYQIIE